MGSLRLLCFALCFLGVQSAAADPRLARLEAALALAHAGLEEGDAGLLITSLEMLADLGPAGPGADALLPMLEEEARFAMRGDPALTARLEAAQVPRDPGALWLTPLDPEVSLPPDRAVLSVVTPGARLLRVGAEGGQACAPPQVTDRCDLAEVPPMETATLAVEGTGRGYALFLLTEPKTP